MDKRILRASHIKPWRLASNEERLDPNNGLILAPTYDLLFDQGFITFEADKTLRISSELSEVTVRKLGLIDGSKFKDLPIGESHQAARLEYLKFHREVIFRK
jgi:predicted restriction endonuclease